MCVPSLITLDTHFLEKGSVHEPAVPKQKHEFVLMLYLIVKVPHIFERLAFVEEEPGAKKKNEINGLKYIDWGIAAEWSYQMASLGYMHGESDVEEVKKVC